MWSIQLVKSKSLPWNHCKLGSFYDACSGASSLTSSFIFLCSPTEFTGSQYTCAHLWILHCFFQCVADKNVGNCVRNTIFKMVVKLPGKCMRNPTHLPCLVLREHQLYLTYCLKPCLIELLSPLFFKSMQNILSYATPVFYL